VQTTPIEQTPEKQLTSDDKESPVIDHKITKEIPKEIPKTVSEPITNTTLSKTNVGTEEGKNKDAGGNNNGNKPGTVGDMGNPNGDINADALLGNGGIGGGASLEMAGWVWDEKPIVQDKSSETGKIVFEIKIDEDGEVISVKNVYSTVSRSVANLYEKAVYDLSFSTTIDNAKRAAVTTGKIVFVLKSK
jgi:stress response protein SCP2